MNALPERIEAKFVPEPNTGCWLWIGARNNGYGAVYFNKKAAPAHRVIYELLVGPIPEGLELDHVRARGCSGPECVNPDHLEPVTGAENVRRGNAPAAIVRRTNVCSSGHVLDEKNSYHTTTGNRQCRKCHDESERRQRRARGVAVGSTRCGICLEYGHNSRKCEQYGPPVPRWMR